jgi:hypothetical protein
MAQFLLYLLVGASLKKNLLVGALTRKTGSALLLHDMELRKVVDILQYFRLSVNSLRVYAIS